MTSIKKKQRLQLEVDGFRERMVKFYEDVEKDPKLQEEFISNTCGVLSERVTGYEVTRHQISEANRLMFAILANDKLVSWLNNYEHKGRRLNKEEFAYEFANKLSDVDDGTIIASIVSNALVGNSLPGLGQIAYQCVVRETNSRDSCTCTPVAKDTQVIGGERINPNTIRSLSEALIKRGKELKEKGQLANLSQII